MTTMTLSQPIQAHGETVRTLTFRTPTGADLVKCGMPFRFTQRNGETSRDIDTIATAALIARLASVPPSSVETMTARDFVEGMAIVTGFLGAVPETSLADTSTSATSSAA